MPTPYRINAEDLEEYFSSLARCSESPMDDDLKLKELMRSYAELKFRIVGGSRCGMCNAHVRHVIPLVSHQTDGEIKAFDCLCTRCFEAEKATSERMFLHVGENRVEVKLKKRNSATMKASANGGEEKSK